MANASRKGAASVNRPCDRLRLSSVAGILLASALPFLASRLAAMPQGGSPYPDAARLQAGLRFLQPGVPKPTRPSTMNPGDNLHFGRSKYSSRDVDGSIPADGTRDAGLPRDPRRPLIDSACQYSSNAEIAALSSSDLIVFLKSTSDYACHARILFSYEDSYSPLIFSSEKIRAVANEVKTIAPTHGGTNSSGLYGLICYLHVAEYFDWYHHSTTPIDGVSLDAIAQATDALSRNSSMFTLNAISGDIMYEFLVVLDITGVRGRPATISFLNQVMTTMAVTATWKTAGDISYVTPYWYLFQLTFRGLCNGDADFIAALSSDHDFLTLLGSVATDADIMNNSNIAVIWQDNAILDLAVAAAKPSLVNIVCPPLATVCQRFPRLHKNWLRAVTAINDAGQCVQYQLCEDSAALGRELKGLLFPNTFSYDDGRLIFQVKCARDVADNLYYATRQTRAQLFRMIQTDQPVAGDVNTALTAIVFESKQVYDDYAPYLYGIDTNNGGMYLERPAEFYTWDRPATYSLSLEELFRHEYSHYLQDRFLIPGFWGEVPFYEKNRLTWYEEGHAEFLSASTDDEGIKLKESTVRRLKAEFPNWPSLSDVLSSYYGQASQIYYPYGNLVWFNWYKNDYARIKLFNDLTRNNDIAGFDEAVSSLKNTASAEAQWRAFLTAVYNGAVPAWQISTEWVSDRQLVVGAIADIKNEFTGVTGRTDIDVTSDASALIGRFRLTGTLTGSGGASSNAEAAQAVNQALDSLIGQLKRAEYINNFHYIVGYVTNVSYTSGVSTADFSVMGSLRDPTVQEAPAADFSSGQTLAMTRIPVRFQSLSKGYIKGCSWSFPGGSPRSSEAANPLVTYNTPGTYPVSLTVTGKDPSITNTKTAAGYMKIVERDTTAYCTGGHGYDFSWIARVKVGGIDNATSGFPPGGYSDFSSALVTELSAGSTYPISVDLNYTNSPSVGIAVWIDLNRNGSFSDPGEQLLLAHVPTLSQLSGGSIAIPIDAPGGVTRMRVRATYDGQAISPCGVDSYMGEIEDYSVLILSVRERLSVAVGGGGRVTSSPAGIDCAGNCSVEFETGTLVDLAPSTQPGFTFSGWSGDCAGAGACKVTMDAARTVTASFTSISCSYAVGPPSTSAGVAAGSTSVTITASPTGCAAGAWAASTADAWLGINPPAGTGAGSVLISWQSNTGAARTGTATIAGSTCTVNQTAARGVESVVPNSGLVAGETSVTIQGSGFQDRVTVTFGGVASATVTVVDPQTIKAVAPSIAAPGPVDVVVTIAGGPPMTLTGGFTYTTSPGRSFYTVTPCRLFDTRNSAGPDSASPALATEATRTFSVAVSRCGIPADAVAISANLTVANVGATGQLVVFPADVLRPDTSAISFRAGRTRANNAIVSFSKSSLAFSVFNNSAGTVDFVLDVNGFFR